MKKPKMDINLLQQKEYFTDTQNMINFSDEEEKKEEI